MGDTLSLDQANLYGQIGAILCWDLSKDHNKSQKLADREQRRIGRLVGLIPEIVAGKLDRIKTGDLFDIADAILTCVSSDQRLRDIGTSCRDAYYERLRQDRPARFRDD